MTLFQNTLLYNIYEIVLVATCGDWLQQWFPNFFGSQTTYKDLVVREGQNIDLYGDSRTTSANLADHQWSAEQTLGITGLQG